MVFELPGSRFFWLVRTPLYFVQRLKVVNLTTEQMYYFSKDIKTMVHYNIVPGGTEFNE